MKLASLNHGRDGRLIIVSSDLSRFMLANGVAATLQDALDDWATTSPRLATLAAEVEAGRGEPLIVRDLAAPLPRAYQWLDGSVYLNHAQLLRRMRKATMPEDVDSVPLMYQGTGDTFAGPTSDILAASEELGIDFEAEIVVILDDVPMGISSGDAASHIQLIGLVNDVSLRAVIIDEIPRGLGLIQGKPSTSFAPVLVTPEELGTAWDGRRLHLPVLSHVNGALVGQPNAGTDMYFDFAELIAHAARTRHLSAGTVIGAGTVSNHDRSVGSSCLAERRMIEMLEGDRLETSWLHFGDNIMIDVRDASGASIFGEIVQTVRQA